MNDDQLTEAIMKKFQIKEISDVPAFFKNKGGEELERCIQQIKCFQGINKNQVARVTRLGRSRIEKIWNKKEPAPNA